MNITPFSIFLFSRYEFQVIAGKSHHRNLIKYYTIKWELLIVSYGKQLYYCAMTRCLLSVWNLCYSSAEKTLDFPFSMLYLPQGPFPGDENSSVISFASRSVFNPDRCQRILTGKRETLLFALISP